MPPVPANSPEDVQRLVDQVTQLNAMLTRDLPADRQKVEALTAQMNELKGSLTTHQQWVSEVQKALNNARHGGGVGRFQTNDELKAVLPDRVKNNLELYGRMGRRRHLTLPTTGKSVEVDNDPVVAVACDTWMKNAARAMAGQKYSPQGTGPLIEECDKISRAMGDEMSIVQKAANSPFALSPNAQGGFTVPTPVEAMVLRVAEDAGVIRPLAMKLPMTVFKHLIPADAGGMSVGVVGEATTIPEAEPTFAQKTLEAKMIAVRGLASLQILQDSEIGLIDYWLTRASEAYALFEDAQALEGNGTDFTGLSQVTSPTDINEVTNGANGAAVSYQKLVEQVYAAKKRSTRKASAAWVMHPFILQRLVQMKDSAGAPLLHRQDIARILSERIVGPGFGEGTILGYSVYATDQVSVARTVGTSSDCSNIYFGPFEDGIILGDLLGLQFAVSEHVKFHEAQLSFRLLKRTAILVAVGLAMTRQVGVRNIAP